MTLNARLVQVATPSSTGHRSSLHRPPVESPRHRRLKELALAWAESAGWLWRRTEVRVPRSGFRADAGAAGAGEGSPVLLFECKQARADWRRDVHEEQAAREELAALTERRARLEAMLALHRPELRRGEALWAEYDTCNFQALRHHAYSRILAAQATAVRRVREGTKFSRMHRYRCADQLYLVIEDGIYARAEIPDGWGLLVRVGDVLELVREAPALAPESRQREALRDVLAGRASAGCTPDDFPELFAHG